MLDFTIVGFLAALLSAHPSQSPMDKAWNDYAACTKAAAHEMTKHPGDAHTLAILAENSCADSLVAYGLLLKRAISEPELTIELQSIRQRSIQISEAQIAIGR